MAGISPWSTLEVLLRLAPVLAGLGDRSKAAALVDKARALLDSMPKGADAQLARLARIEQRLVGRPQPASPGEPLTEREQEVLRLLQGTLSLRGIGREVYLSPNTIKTHTRALYCKLDVSDRQDAVSAEEIAAALVALFPMVGGGRLAAAAALIRAAPGELTGSVRPTVPGSGTGTQTRYGTARRLTA